MIDLPLNLPDLNPLRICDQYQDLGYKNCIAPLWPS